MLFFFQKSWNMKAIIQTFSKIIRYSCAIYFYYLWFSAWTVLMLMIILSSQIEEEESFELLCHLMYDLGLRKLYKPNMAGLQVSMYQLARLMRYDNIISLSYNYDRDWLCECGIFLHFSHYMWDCWLFKLGILMSIPQCNILEIPDTPSQWWHIRFWLGVMEIPVPNYVVGKFSISDSPPIEQSIISWHLKECGVMDLLVIGKLNKWTPVCND